MLLQSIEYQGTSNTYLISFQCLQRADHQHHLAMTSKHGEALKEQTLPIASPRDDNRVVSLKDSANGLGLPVVRVVGEAESVTELLLDASNG